MLGGAVPVVRIELAQSRHEGTAVVDIPIQHRFQIQPEQRVFGIVLTGIGLGDDRRGRGKHRVQPLEEESVYNGEMAALLIPALAPIRARIRPTWL